MQFHRLVVSNSLWPHELQHARRPCSSPTPGVYSDSCPLSRWWHPTFSSLSSPSPPASIFPSIKVFSNWVSSLHQVAKVLEFQLQHQSFQWISGLISFRIDWVYLLAVQETLRSSLQYHSSKVSILWPSAFFIAQLSHPCMTTGKTIALTRQTFVDKLMSMLFFFF